MNPMNPMTDETNGIGSGGTGIRPEIEQTQKYTQVYVSGPMTGEPDQNRKLFARATLDLRKLGYTVINPHELNPSPCEWVDSMKLDIKALVDCHAIYMLPGWVNSKGANLEHTIAKALGLRTIYRSGS